MACTVTIRPPLLVTTTFWTQNSIRCVCLILVSHCAPKVFLIRCLWGQPWPVPSSACTSSNIRAFDERLSEQHSDHNELELPLQSFSVLLSSNVLPLLSCEQMCFESYKEPQQWLNHLFRNHHLHGLVAMLTRSSNAPGAPGSNVSVPLSEPQRWAGTVLPPLLLGPLVLTHHFTCLIGAPTLSSP